jgi:hypothetical protein
MRGTGGDMRGSISATRGSIRSTNIYKVGRLSRVRRNGVSASSSLSLKGIQVIL